MTHHQAHSHEPMQDFGRQSWEERYRAKQAVWSGRPTQVLVDEVEPLLEPATVLEFGCGEGADAVWLAQHGWLVTAVDLSSTALERARKHAEQAGVDQHITFTDADADDVIREHGPWALVTSMYAHPEQGARWLVETLSRAVAPGGMLVIVGHHPTDPHAADKPDLLAAAFTAEEVAQALDRDVWEVSATLRERTTREAHGGERLWRDAVLVARRD